MGLSFDLSSCNNFLQLSKSTILIGLFGLLVLLLNLRKRVSRKNEPPEVAGGWPIIGHLHHFMGGKNKLLHVAFGAWADKYGPIFTLRMGLYKVLVVSSAEVAKECSTTNDMVFIARPYQVASEVMGYGYAMFPLAPYGEFYVKMRKMVTQELLSNSRVDSLKHVWGSEITNAIQKLHQKLVSTKGGAPTLVNMKGWLTNLTFRTVMKVICGGVGGDDTSPAASVTSNGGDNNDEVSTYQKALREFFVIVGELRLSDVVPFLGWLDNMATTYLKRMKDNGKFLNILLEEMLEEHKRKRRSLSEEEKKDGGYVEQDFMDVMISKLKDPKLLSYYDADTINKSTCLTLILSGSETTMTSIVWALSLLVDHPHVIKKAQDELDTHVGRERQVNESDIKNLVYLQAIVKEALRLYPPAPLTSPRISTEDCVVSGYHVPAGTRLFINMWKIQRNPEVWHEPLEFRPERFFTTNKDYDIGGKHYDLHPFGSGRRACPGASFALQLVHLSLASLLHGFDIKNPSNEPIDMTESPGVNNLKATPLKLLVTPRLFSKETY
uniref:Putative cytochrome P450 n=1 Tax=Eschscholzia californica subsp. californica TaxID=222997 RepID=A0A2Z6BXX5_ESCCA|nr:putative cytochrome P450 [Eschscholzia californica subsp. californica]